MRLSSLLSPLIKPAMGFALAALLVAACTSSDDSGSSGGPTPAGGDPLALDQIGAAIAPVYCDIVKTCQGPGFNLAFSDAATCQQQITDGFTEASYPTLKAAVDSGNAVYDGTKAAACLGLLKAQGCAFPTVRLSLLCPDLLVGKVAEGASCTSNSECVNDHYCKVDAACPGKCTPLIAEGQACTDTDNCASGFQCDSTLKTCTKPGAIGAACQQGKPSCGLDSVCVGTDDKTMTPGTCKAFGDLLSAAQGAACDISKTALCVIGSSCSVDKIAATGASYLCVAPVASGAACKLAVPTMCPAGEFCDGVDTGAGKFDGTCKALPTQGQACAGNIGGNSCAEGLVCGSDSKCKARGKNGVACASKSECYGDCVKGVCAPENSCTM